MIDGALLPVRPPPLVVGLRGGVHQLWLLASARQ